MNDSSTAASRRRATHMAGRLSGAPAGARRLHLVLLAAAALANLGLPAATGFLAVPGSITAHGPLATSGSLAAQDAESPAAVTLEGEVLDNANGLPVAVAIVAIPALNRSAVTDELGYFRIADIPAGYYPIRVMRLGYETLEAEVPINGREVLALHLTPGPVPIEGIDVEVIGREDIANRAMGISSRGIIGPVEMDELRQRYFSLDQVLSSRYMPRARFRHGREPGDPGCLMVTNLSLRGRNCAAIVVDGVLMGPSARDWVYRMSTHDIFSVRFLYGPAAALRYGHRGSDGVLFIETRAGR